MHFGRKELDKGIIDLAQLGVERFLEILILFIVIIHV